jgi:hypothetical protein
MAVARSVDVVVPSPTTSPVRSAACRMSWAKVFLVVLQLKLLGNRHAVVADNGPPHLFSMSTHLDFGPQCHAHGVGERQRSVRTFSRAEDCTMFMGHGIALASWFPRGQEHLHAAARDEQEDDARVLCLTQGSGRIRRVAHGAMVDFENHIIGPQAGRLCRTPRLDIVNHGPACSRAQAQPLCEVGRQIRQRQAEASSGGSNRTPTLGRRAPRPAVRAQLIASVRGGRSLTARRVFMRPRRPALSPPIRPDR